MGSSCGQSHWLMQVLEGNLFNFHTTRILIILSIKNSFTQLQGHTNKTGNWGCTTHQHILSSRKDWCELKLPFRQPFWSINLDQSKNAFLYYSLVFFPDTFLTPSWTEIQATPHPNPNELCQKSTSNTCNQSLNLEVIYQQLWILPRLRLTCSTVLSICSLPSAALTQLLISDWVWFQFLITLCIKKKITVAEHLPGE